MGMEPSDLLGLAAPPPPPHPLPASLSSLIHQEFVYNKAQRLMFDQSSANGILLFREASKILVAYGSRVLQHPPRPGAEIYKVKGSTHTGETRRQQTDR